MKTHEDVETDDSKGEGADSVGTAKAKTTDVKRARIAPPEPWRSTGFQETLSRFLDGGFFWRGVQEKSK